MNRFSQKIASLCCMMSTLATSQIVTKDSILSYDPNSEIKVISNFELSREDLNKMETGVKEQLLDYIPSEPVFDQIGGYIKPQLSNSSEPPPELLIEVPKLQIEIRPTTPVTTHHVQIQMFNEYVPFGEIVGEDRLEIRYDPKYGYRSDRYRDFAVRCQGTPPPTDFSKLNLQVAYECRVSLPQISIRHRDRPSLVLDRSSGSILAYSGVSKAQVLSNNGRMISSNVAPLLPNSDWVHARFDHRFYACTYVAELKLDLAHPDTAEVTRCLGAILSGFTPSSQKPESEELFQTPVQAIIDRAILALVKTPTQPSRRPVYVAPPAQDSGKN